MSEHLTRMIAEDAILTFAEPHPTGGDAVVTITARKAVAFQMRGRDYESDEAALDDFMVVNWATEAPAKRRLESSGVYVPPTLSQVAAEYVEKEPEEPEESHCDQCDMQAHCQAVFENGKTCPVFGKGLVYKRNVKE